MWATVIQLKLLYTFLAVNNPASQQEADLEKSLFEQVIALTNTLVLDIVHSDQATEG